MIKKDLEENERVEKEIFDKLQKEKDEEQQIV
jgi:hypothetical protein